VASAARIVVMKDGLERSPILVTTTSLEVVAEGPVCEEPPCVAVFSVAASTVTFPGDEMPCIVGVGCSAIPVVFEE
jgi:hypothetical protein